MTSVFKLTGLFIMLFSMSINAQDFQGKAYYFSKTTMDMGNFGGRQMSDQQKKMIADRMKNMLEKTYVLTFNQTESTYKEEEKLQAPGAGGGGGRWGGMMSSFTGGPQYKNVKSKQILQEQEFFGKQFLVKDSLPQLEWKMENETKQIGQYTCFKATAIKPADEMDFTNWRRRGRNNDDEKKDTAEAKDSTKTDLMSEIEVPKHTIITAWYTPQIPINQGPADYWGLPGLIMEVNDGKTVVLCNKIIINPQDKETIEAPKKGKEVTRDEYNTIMKEKMEEMREMYGGRGGRRGN